MDDIELKNDLKKILLDLERIKLKNNFHSENKFNGIFTIGIKSNPSFITISSQINRAFLLAESIFNEYKEKASEIRNNGGATPLFQIAVVGSGFSGIMFTRYLSELSKRENSFKLYIRVLEKREMLCPIQRGSLTRRVHPSVHKFPRDKWEENVKDYRNKFFINNEELITEETKYDGTGLFFKSCMAGELAQEFAISLIKKVDSEYVKSNKNLSLLVKASSPFVDVWQNTKLLQVSPNMHGKDLKFKIICKGEQVFNKYGEYNEVSDSIFFDTVVLATGPGVENSDLNYRTNSYWRNDDLGQVQLYKQNSKFIISGNGDGAVTDFLRMMIMDYKQDLTLKDYFSSKKNMAKEIIEESKYFKKHFEKDADVITEEKTNVTEMVEGAVKALLKNYEDLISYLMAISEYGNENLYYEMDNQSLFDVLENYWKLRKGLKGSYSILELFSEKLSFYQNKNIECIFHFKNDQKQSVETIVNNHKVTLYNRILFYLVWKNSNVKFSNLELNKLVEFNKVPQDQVIIRHGADRFSIIEEIGLSEYIELENIDMEKVVTSFIINKYQINRSPKMFKQDEYINFEKIKANLVKLIQVYITDSDFDFSENELKENQKKVS